MKISLRTQRIILMIGDDGIVVVPYEIPNTTPFLVPAENRLAAQQIIEFIARHPQARITLFADNMAQDYRTDDLPPLHLFDRSKLVHRRLTQTFPSARLTGSLRFRKNPRRVMMIGLHESNPVFAWADRLRARLPDIALLPVEGAQVAAQLMPEAARGWAMLVSRQKSGGFRQIVTFQNDLIFTRLTPLPPAGDFETGAETVAHDIKASLEYLTRHGLRDPQELSVLLLMPDNIHTAIELKKLPLQSIRSLSPKQAAQQLSLPFAPSDNSSDILFAAHLCNKTRSVLSLRLPDARRAWLTQSVRRWGMRVGLAALLSVSMGTVWRAGDLAATLYQTQKESAQLNETQRALTQAQANAAPITEPLGRMRQALERRHIYEQPTPLPWHGLNELAASLDPDAKISRLDWKVEGTPAQEIFTVELRFAHDAEANDRAEVVAAFARAAQNVAHAMPDFAVEITKPPYPALPQESVTSSAKDASNPIGEISIRRNTP